MEIKTLLIGAALLAAVQPAFAEAQEVTATWAMANGDAYKNSVFSSDNTLFTAELTTGDNLPYLRDRSWTTLDEQTINFSSFRLPPLTANNIDENAYLEVVVTPTTAIKLKEFSFFIAGISTGDAQCKVTVNDTEVFVTNGSSNALKRNNNESNYEDYKISVALSSIPASDQTYSIKVYTYSRADVKENAKEIAFSNVNLTAAKHDDVEVPEIPEDAVVVPFTNGTFYDLNNATVTNAQIQSNPTEIGSTHSNTEIVYPFYVVEDNTNIFFYLATSAKDTGTGILDIYLDDTIIGEHEVTNTNSWTTFTAVSILPLNDLTAGQHNLKITVRECVSYAGNWKVSFHSAAIYNHATIDLTAGTYVNGIRHENSGANVGNIRKGAYAEYKIYIPEAGQYAMNIGINPYGEGTCTASIKEEGIETSFPIINAARSYSDVRQIPLGDINTPGIKTLRLDFAADHDGYITNYDQLGLERTGNTSGIADAVAAEEVAVEYYNLQGVRVQGEARGTLIRVATAADGSRTATKVVVR